jgi:hypothetical protein
MRAIAVGRHVVQVTVRDSLSHHPHVLGGSGRPHPAQTSGRRIAINFLAMTRLSALRTHDSTGVARILKLDVPLPPRGDGTGHARPTVGAVEDLELRAVIYGRIVDTGTPPSRAEVVEAIGDPEEADARLRRLHDAHMVVLDDRPHRRGEIRMALPFAGEPTGFRVANASGGWWANCAWDSLAVVAAIHDDAHIDATWSDTGEHLEIDIVDGRLSRSDGFVHFQVPAQQWWDDIVFT